MKNYHIYHIQLVNKRITSIKLQYPKVEDEKIANFLSPVNQDKISKLYIVKSYGKPVYVGIARQGIQKRLKYGLKPSASQIKNGYHGYGWGGKIKQIDLYVWYFSNHKDLKRVEAIEAEIVYLIKKNGEWPRYQSEIHFHRPDKQAESFASKIYKVIERN